MSEKRTTKPLDQALRELVDASGLTEDQLASRTTVTQGTINKYLRSRRGLQMNSRSVETVRQIAAALSVPPEYFLEYRQWKAKQLVGEAMAAGQIDLEDIELILAGKKYRGAQPGSKRDG
jgi:transcriptional regulator with XRE-family HTH domain